MDELLQVHVRRTTDGVVAEVVGDLDIATAARLRAALEPLVGEPRLVVDLHGVGFCGARGLYVLLETADLLDAHGGRLVLTRTPAPVERLMEMLHVSHRFLRGIRLVEASPDEGAGPVAWDPRPTTTLWT